MICTLTNLLSAWIFTPRFQLMWENTLGSQGYCTLAAWQTTNLKWGGNWKYVWLEQLYFTKENKRTNTLAKVKDTTTTNLVFHQIQKRTQIYLDHCMELVIPALKRHLPKFRNKKRSTVSVLLLVLPLSSCTIVTQPVLKRDVPAKLFWCLNICRYIYWLNWQILNCKYSIRIRNPNNTSDSETRCFV